MSRIRANQITNQSADGAPTVQNGLVISGVTTSTTFSGSGASLTNLPAAQLSGTAAAINGSNITNLNGSNIASGTVPVARIGTGTKNTSTFYRGDGTFATVTAPAITAINSASNNRIVTSDGGTTVTAESGLRWSGAQLYIESTGDSQVRLQKPSSDPNDWNYIEFAGADGTRDTYFGTWSDGRPVWSRDSNGLNVFLESDGVTLNGHLYPQNNNQHDLGKNTKRWRNIYTGDLHLSNEGLANNDGHGNSVDDTWGDWTIQEGENDLFLLNNRNGKKYKFNLTEVS